MKVLERSENIESIMLLIEQAKEFVVIVSPYSYLVGWERLKIAINNASAKGIAVSYFVRKGEGKNGLEGLNVAVFEVPGLHAKIFFSESQAIISSFHLMNNQDINWACSLNFPEEYNEMVHFFESYIKPESIVYMPDLYNRHYTE